MTAEQNRGYQICKNMSRDMHVPEHDSKVLTRTRSGLRNVSVDACGFERGVQHTSEGLQTAYRHKKADAA